MYTLGVMTHNRTRMAHQRVSCVLYMLTQTDYQRVTQSPSFSLNTECAIEGNSIKDFLKGQGRPAAGPFALVRQISKMDFIELGIILLVGYIRCTHTQRPHLLAYGPTFSSAETNRVLTSVVLTRANGKSKANKYKRPPWYMNRSWRLSIGQTATRHVNQVTENVQQDDGRLSCNVAQAEKAR